MQVLREVYLNYFLFKKQDLREAKIQDQCDVFGDFKISFIISSPKKC